VDTLDNMGFEHTGKQLNFFGLTDANSERIVKQNSKPIMLVIGNPPYNAHQINANEDNPNRKYPAIDERIQKTYVKHSKAQNLTKLYDMYTRFLRWASDRLDKNGVVAFVSNSSFINARIYDGFRKVVAQEFNEIYVVDLKGDARTSGERRRREGGNIFSNEIRVGVAIYFLVRKEKTKGCRIFYNTISDYATAEDKKSYLRDNKLSNLSFQLVHPSKNFDWVNVEENDWDELLPVVTKQTKESNAKASNAIFKNFHIGAVTARDEWVTDYSTDTLEQKMRLFVDTYRKQLSANKLDTTIKWSRNLRRNLERAASEEFDQKRIKKYLYRPFVKMALYDSDIFINDRAILKEVVTGTNSIICFTAPGSEKAFMSLGSEFAVDFHLVGAGSGTQCLPLYRYDESGERVENVTDWALGQFQKKYKDKKITKEDIFHYVYAVLHHPAYRAKYEINLKREFPRIPFYEDFRQWAEWGKRLVELHLNYERVEPYKLEREDKAQEKPATRLIARKDKDIIEVDTSTVLGGIPAEAWEYRLGTYSALEWILERYKEKKPKDPTIAEKFNTYRFADYKEQVINLLLRVCTVSVETMKIIKEMPE
jgi:predicted helicase